MFQEKTKFMALNIIILMFAMLSTGNTASICDESITPLNEWDPYSQYNSLGRFSKIPCKDRTYPANFRGIGCCSDKVEKFSWTFTKKNETENIRLTCYAQNKTADVPLGYFKLVSEDNKICELRSASLIKTISKSNALEMDFSNINPFCMVCMAGKDTASIHTTQSKEVDSEEKGRDPTGQKCECGKCKDIPLRKRIFNGTEITNLEKYPWMVSLQYREGVRDSELKFFYLCGGSVIGKFHVLTAAHCVDDAPVDLFAHIGDTHIFGVNGRRMRVEDQRIHEKYQRKKANDSQEASAQYDIAILYLYQLIPEYLYMPICIPKTSLIKKNDVITTLGWGLKGPYEPKFSKNQLKKTHIKVVAPDWCERIYGNTSFTKENQICTFSRNHSVCLKDSGGPWMVVDRKTNRYNLVGITSYQSGLCDAVPNVQTAVHYYYDWIQHAIGTNPYEMDKCNMSF